MKHLVNVVFRCRVWQTSHVYTVSRLTFEGRRVAPVSADEWPLSPHPSPHSSPHAKGVAPGSHSAVETTKSAHGAIRSVSSTKIVKPVIKVVWQ